MLVENTYDANNWGQNYNQHGLAIKLRPGKNPGMATPVPSYSTTLIDSDSADLSMNFITFYTHSEYWEDYDGRDTEHTLGAIEGQMVEELQYDNHFIYENTQMWLDYNEDIVTGWTSALSNALSSVPGLSFISTSLDGLLTQLTSTIFYGQKTELLSNYKKDNMGVVYKSGGAIMQSIYQDCMKMRFSDQDILLELKMEKSLKTQQIQANYLLYQRTLEY